MPNLSQLTDYNPMGDYIGGTAEPVDTAPVVQQPSNLSHNIDKILNSLFRDDEERYQLWPEKVLRSGASAAHDVISGETPQWAVDPNTGDVHTSPQMIERAQDMSALAGTGGLGGVTDATLGATPFLRPALKYKDRLYKGKEGQQHMDVIPQHLYPEFQDMAMKGEDISHYNFGFVNDKGQFLNREAALEYGINTGLIDPQAGKFGALTSTLMADSSKPGTAIEALAKSGQDAFHGTATPGFNKFNTPDAGQYMPDRGLGVHVSKDPEIANTFVKDNGAVYPVKIPPDEKFYNVKQDLLPYIEDKNTPKHGRNVISDQNAIESEIYRVAYKKDPAMFARFLEARWNMSKADAEAAAKNVLAGKPQRFHGRPVEGLDDYIKHDGVVKSWNEADRAKATEIFKKDLQDKGYAGVKYINTSPMETANAKDHTSYVIFKPNEHILSKYTNTLMADSSKPGTAIQAMKNWNVKGHENSDWYHGSVRSDRVVETGKLEPKRATSGPMPYFTDDPEMASSYAMGKKPDTSLAKSDTGESVANYFTVAPKDLGYTRAKTPMTVEQSYHHLPKEKQAEIADKAHRIGYENRDAAEGPFTLHNEHGGPSSKEHYDYILKHEAKGNPLAALRILWHDSGNLIGNESELADIYKLAGYPHKISENTAPWVEARGVVPVKLKMNNPLKTDNKEEILNKVIPHLEEVFKNDRSRLKQGGVDMWDKESQWTPKTWIKQLKEDTDKGIPGYTWTSIPDKITNALKQLGYDGIVDTGGKAGGKGHNVAIPFEPHQVRSRFAQFNPANEGKSGLLLSDTSQPGVALQALQKANPFYSALEHNVSKITQSKMTGDQWLSTLSNKPGVKPEEMNWTGLKSFLEENKGKAVTKEQIEDHLAANKVEIKDVNKGLSSDPYFHYMRDSRIAHELKTPADIDLAKKHNANFSETFKGMSDREILRLAREVEATKDIGETKYHSYQLPGGENYREKLLTLPKQVKDEVSPSATASAKYMKEWDALVAERQKLTPLVDDYNRRLTGEEWEKAKADLTAVNKKMDVLHNQMVEDTMKESPLKYGEKYKSSHWDEPNILAHVRMNDRTMPIEYTAEQKAALKAHEDAQLKLEAIRKEQGETGKDIRFKARSLEFDRNAKIQDDLKAGKLTHLEALRKIDEPVEHPELKELQDKLVALRSKEDALRKSLPEKPSSYEVFDPVTAEIKGRYATEAEAKKATEGTKLDYDKSKGLKALHIEEIQSDWHQQGRARGYSTKDIKDKKEYFINKLEELKETLKDVEKNTWLEETGGKFKSGGEFANNVPKEFAHSHGSPEHLKAVEEFNRISNLVEDKRKPIKEQQLALSKAHNELKDSGIPDAPFKKTWHELALKRMIREAAEKGYDRLSWTPGEAQAARYDLSKQVNKIHFTNTEKGYLIAPEGHNGHEIPVNNGQPIPKEKLADYVGKEIAEKIIEKADKTIPFKPVTELPKDRFTVEEFVTPFSNADNPKFNYGVVEHNDPHRIYASKWSTKEEAIKAALDKYNRDNKSVYDKDIGTLENVDLKIGGEGMKGFYDKIVPDFLNKIGKEHGVKVKTYEPKKIEASPEEINKLAKTLYETYERRGGDVSWENLHPNKKKHFEDLAKEKSDLVDNKGHTVHYIDIPQSLKDQAMHKGFPLFSSTHMFIPVDHEPEFKKNATSKR